MYYICKMKRTICFLLLISVRLSVMSQQMTALEYYVAAFNEMSDMLSVKDEFDIACDGNSIYKHGS